MEQGSHIEQERSLDSDAEIKMHREHFNRINHFSIKIGKVHYKVFPLHCAAIIILMLNMSPKRINRPSQDGHLPENPLDAGEKMVLKNIIELPTETPIWKQLLFTGGQRIARARGG